MSDWSSGTCPRHEECEFYRSVINSPLARIKYATMYPYCKRGKHESCMRWFLMEADRPVPEDLLPDGGKDVFVSHGGRASVSPIAARVLVVDDLPLFRKSLVTMVSKACGTCQIQEASSGEEALRILADSPGGWQLVVTDYNMGAVSGYDLVEHMRANPALSGIPVVVFSSETDPLIQQKLTAFPRVRWLAKLPHQEPFDAAWNDLVRDGKA